jgi:Flp pilus assembly protein TadG
MPGSSNRRHAQRGLAVVEAAIVLPLLLLLLVAVGELGRAFYQYNTLQRCVRDATRHLAANAISNDTKLIDITPQLTATTRALGAYGSPGGGTPLLPDLAPANFTVSQVNATQVRVTGTYQYQARYAAIPTFGLGDGNVGFSKTFTVAVTMSAI